MDRVAEARRLYLAAREEVSAWERALAGVADAHGLGTVSAICEGPVSRSYLIAALRQAREGALRALGVAEAALLREARRDPEAEKWRPKDDRIRSNVERRREESEEDGRRTGRDEETAGGRGPD